LTNFRKLRSFSKREGIDVKGLLFIFDEILRCKLVERSAFKEAIKKLAKLNPRIEKILRKWQKENL
jgi:hypothetical protein